MLSLPPSVRLFVATQPVDGRKGVDSLMVIVRDVFRHDPLSGEALGYLHRRNRPTEGKRGVRQCRTPRFCVPHAG